ncbi:MAG: endonuclease/exonuclease/phosphatase family protein [Pseudomonadota bacterium]
MLSARALLFALCFLTTLTAGAGIAPRAQDLEIPPLPAPAEGAIRVAQFNAALNRAGAGVLLSDIRKGHPQVSAVAAIIRAVRPDILLLNEFDRDAEGRALDTFAAQLAKEGAAPIDYAHRFHAPVNTGVPSHRDLDRDGRSTGPGDAWGWGAFPGQYGMAVLSRYPIRADAARSWQRFPWSALPGALRPIMPDGTPFHDDETWNLLRLSSKSHWALPIDTPAGSVTLVAAHPTPPVFDGPENRNGRRNHDEIRLLHAIATDPGADWLVDDTGTAGGLAEGTLFVIAGDLNADPADGAAERGALKALLADDRLQDPKPSSEGAVTAAREQGAGNDRQKGSAAQDTADWRDTPGPGNLRVDYVLPASRFEVTASGVFWPAPGEAGAPLMRTDKRPASSDHRLVWVDIRLP